METKLISDSDVGISRKGLQNKYNAVLKEKMEKFLTQDEKKWRISPQI